MSNVVDVVAANGLEGVVVAETRLSSVDGAAGRLILAGHDVEEVAARGSYEDACGLLWDGALPSAARRSELVRLLSQARTRAFERISDLGDALERTHAMDALRAAAAHLDGERTAREEVVASLAVFTAAWVRRRNGLDPVAPTARPHAEDLLAMM